MIVEALYIKQVMRRNIKPENNNKLSSPLDFKYLNILLIYKETFYHPKHINIQNNYQKS